MTPEVLCLGRSNLITTVPKRIAAFCGLRIPLLLDVFSRSIPLLSVCHAPFCTGYPLLNHVSKFTEETFAMCADGVGSGLSSYGTVLT